jgi:hypothetical protein
MADENDENNGPKSPWPKNAKASSSSAKDEDFGDDLVRRALEKGKGKSKAT